MQSSLLDYAFSVLAFYKTAAGLRVKSSLWKMINSAAYLLLCSTKLLKYQETRKNVYTCMVA